jgi:hypothetical protein
LIEQTFVEQTFEQIPVELTMLGKRMYVHRSHIHMLAGIHTKSASQLNRNVGN